MTPDIVIGASMPSPREYSAHLTLLGEIEAAGAKGLSAWRATTLSDVEARAWVALFRCGLVRTRNDRPWNVIVLTPYGVAYLEERK